MAKLDDLAAAVAETKAVAESAIVLINGIADRIEAAGVDEVQLASLTASLREETADLAAAVSANTPSA